MLATPWLPLTLFFSPILGQLSFGGSSDNRNPPNKGSSLAKNNTENRFFFDGTLGLPTSGNEAVDGAIIGLGVGAGLGAVGAAVLGPGVEAALNQNSCGRGRRRRQTSFPGGGSGSSGSSGGFGGAQSTEFGQTGEGSGGQEVDGDQRFFLPSGGSCTCSGRRKRQAPGEDDVNNRFFGLENLLNFGNVPHCGSCCYGNNQQFNNNGFNHNNGGFNNNNAGFNNNNGGFSNNNGGFSNNNGGFSNNNGESNNGGGSSNNFSNGGQQNTRCECEYSLTFRDRYGKVHGACRRTDNTGKTWCYTTGWQNRACQDLQTSKKFPNNPWSYRACDGSRSSG